MSTLKLFEKPGDLEHYLFRITDNGGATADRYTVAFTDGSCLVLSRFPSHPQGISFSEEGLDPAVLQEWVENGDAIDLALGDLSPDLVNHILWRNNEGFADFLEAVERNDPRVVAPSREMATANEGCHTSLGKGIYLRDGRYWLKRDGEPDEDFGPMETARQAVLASIPDAYGLAGPEYQSTLDVMRLTPDKKILKAIKDLERRRDIEYEATISRQSPL